MKKIKKLLATVMILCMGIINTMGYLNVNADEQQINYAGELSTGENIAVSKIIEATDMENVFDITLRVETKSEIHKYYEQPPMSVVVVLDISNTMFTNYTNGVSRFDAAMEAMNEFITDYAASSDGAIAPRELAIVTFNTSAQVQQSLIDCAKDGVTADSICTSVENKIATQVGDLSVYNESNTRYTNIEAGLRLAENILAQSATENQYVILLTDGMPTTYSKNHNNTSVNKITGYDPIMMNATGTVGQDGVFYDSATGCYCLAGVNYSDVGAKYAQERAEAIKNKGIQIYSIGIDIGTKRVSDFLRNDYGGIGSTVDYNSGDDLVIESSTSNKFSNEYKNWLYNEIGSQYYVDGNNAAAMNTAFEGILGVMDETAKEYVVEAWKTADPMNSATSTSENVEFMKFISKSGSFVDELNGAAGVGNENKASFDTSTDTIDWILPESGYTELVNGNEKTYIYELTYRIRLKNEIDGFVPNTPLETNGETTLSYMVNDNGKIAVKTINYNIPKVVGYLGEFSFNKIDDSGNNISVSGAEFTLSHSTSCVTCLKMDQFDDKVSISDMVSVSDADGVVKFTKIPSGHEYKLKETNAPIGHIASGDVYNVTINNGVVKINNSSADNFKYVINEREKYSLNYVIVSNVNPDVVLTDATPSTVTNIPYDTNQVLSGKLTTECYEDANGNPGSWKFLGWYDNENCSGTPIDIINIKQDETVYGKWEFTPQNPPKYNVTYIVNPDPVYGIPGDTNAPVDNNEYSNNATVTVAANLNTGWTTSNGTTMGTDKGVPGVWTFSGWDKNDFTITENTTITGSWTFEPTPETYTLEYVIVSTDNPRVGKTDATPSTVTNIVYNEDRVLAAGLTTTDLMSSDDKYVNWIFSGWYDNAECTGTPISVINIKENETVYGKWTYTLRNHTVEYKVTGDSKYGIPQDTTIPATETYNYFDTVSVANNQYTSWTTSDGTPNGIPGSWDFSSWDKTPGSNFTITADTVIRGSWEFVPDTYSLEYVIVTSDNPNAGLTTPTPSMVTDIPYDTNKMLAEKLTTTDTVNDLGAGDVIGTWRFSGWYTDVSCTGNRAEVINIKADETVYGKWEFIPGDKYIVTYEVEPDPTYGKPVDSVAPEDLNEYQNGDLVAVKDNLTTSQTTSDGTPNGYKGTWTFTPWDKDDFVITGNTTIRGAWTFTPASYTLEYVIVSNENPDAKDTDATPSKVTGIPAGTDVTLALPLETLSKSKDGVPGAWRFLGWYDNAICSGTPVDSIDDISEDTTVYGKWEFAEGKLLVDYVVTGDSTYGVPGDTETPTDSNWYDVGDLVDVKDNLTTSWTTSDGTPNGIPGEWKFEVWDKDDFNIQIDTTIYGEWKFYPVTHKLNYVIVSTDNPDVALTASTPVTVEGIVHMDDVTLAGKLTTTDTTKGSTEGAWKFLGWYDNEACSGNPITIVNDITSDITVYGKWVFEAGNIVAPPTGNTVNCWMWLGIMLLAMGYFVGSTFIEMKDRIRD